MGSARCRGGRARLRRPVAVNRRPDYGLVYVTEAGNHRVSVFEPDGTFVRHIGSFGDEPGQFPPPFEAMTDTVGDVYVMDDVHQSFSKFDASGAFAWWSNPRAGP